MAEAALGDLLDREGKKTAASAAGEPDPVFATREEVCKYLVEAGYAAKYSTVCLHCKQGKLLPAAGGYYRRRDVDRYAGTHLKEAATGMKKKSREDQLQRKKLEMELENLELQNKTRSLQYEKEMGKYVEKERMEMELAGRMTVLKSGYKHWIQSTAVDMIRLVGGEVNKTGELINMATKEFDRHLHQYSKEQEWEVEIGEDVEEDTSEDHTTK